MKFGEVKKGLKSGNGKSFENGLGGKGKGCGIGIEKERLYEENLELKVLNNSLREEMIKLRTKVQQIEKELNKKDENGEKLVFSVKPTNMISNLKAKIKDLKFKVQEKSEEVEILQRNIKLTKTQEHEKEILVYREECIRLKELLNETLGPNDALQKVLSEKHSNLNSLIESINKENKDLQKDLTFYKQELEKYKQKLFELEKKKKQVLKPDVNALKKEISKLKELNENFTKSLYEASNKERGFRDEIFKLKSILKDSQCRVEGLEISLKEANLIIDQLNSDKDKMKDKTGVISEENLQINQLKSMPLMISTIRQAVSKANLEIDSFLDNLDRTKSGRITYENFSQALKKLGTNLTTSHFNSIPSACIKSESKLDLSILKSLLRASETIPIINLKEHPSTNIINFESPVHSNSPKPFRTQTPSTQNPKSTPLKISILPPVNPPKDSNSSCRHSRHTKSKTLILNNTKLKESDLNNTTEPKRSSKTISSKAISSKSSLSSKENFSVLLISHIALKMQLNRLPKQKLLITLFGAIDKNKLITRPDLENCFQKSPFCFSSSPELEQLFHFLLTPNATFQSVGEKLLQSLPDWQIFSTGDEELLDGELGQIISKNKEILKEKCKVCDLEQKGCIQLSEFEKILQDLSLTVSEKLWSYMKLLFYSHGFQLDSVPYRYFIKAFGNPVEYRLEYSNVSENPDAQIVNMYLSGISNALRTTGLTLEEVFVCDDDGLIFVEQFKDGLKYLEFEIDEGNVAVFMDALRFQGSIEVCLSVEEMSEILRNFEGRVSQVSASSFEGFAGDTEMDEIKEFGVIKLVDLTGD